MDERNKLEAYLEALFLEHGPEVLVESLSFLFDAFIVTKNAVVLGASDSFLNFVDIQRDTLCGTPAIQLVPDYEKKRLNDIFANTATEPFVLDLLSLNDSILHTRVSPKLFYVQDQAYLLTEFVDITEAREAQIELNKCEEKFNAIFSHGAVGIARIAIDTKCLEVNQKLCDILGYSEAELMTLSFREVTHPDDLDSNAALVAEIVTGKRNSYSLEKRYIRKNGEIIWCRLSASMVKDPDNNPLYAVIFVEDISDRIELTERLQISDRIVTASTDMLAIIDENGVYRATNATYSRVFGNAPNFLVGKHVEKVFGQEFANNTIKPKIARAIKGEPVNYSAWFDFPNKTKRYLNVSYSPIKADDKKICGIAVSARDITDLKNAEIELQEMNEKLEQYSFVDGLTKITNRRMLDENLTKEWNRAQRVKSPLAFIMIDIDYFKNYNDHYGHLQGDDCLIKIASILNEIVNRSTDIVARFGGEEFAILAPYSDLTQALKLAEICRLAIEEEKIPHAFTGDPKLDIVTISIGVSSIVPSKKNNSSNLIEAADRLLYKAKNAGRNCVRGT